MRPLFLDDQLPPWVESSFVLFLLFWRFSYVCVYFGIPSTYICSNVLTGANAHDDLIILSILELGRD